MPRDAFSPVPVQVLGISDATAITAGSIHTCALREGGAISCWGANWSGQLGNGENRRLTISSVPVQVSGITDATAIATGSSYSCALRESGTISCWGSNHHGKLGNGTTRDSLVPVQVTGITDATAISAGGTHTCALRQDGTVLCWGHNSFGQLGNGQSGEVWYDISADSAVPVEVAGITDATAIAAGIDHSCALHEDGTISCWGRNERGGLGNGQSGDAANSSVPVQVFGITDATAITAGWRHSCALRQGGTISCWGSNNRDGELGNGTTRDSLVPVQVTGITVATAITTGSVHSCALHQDGTISCWGYNDYGELGNRQSGDDEFSSVPVQVVGFGG